MSAVFLKLTTVEFCACEGERVYDKILVQPTSIAFVRPLRITSDQGNQLEYAQLYVDGYGLMVVKELIDEIEAKL